MDKELAKIGRKWAERHAEWIRNPWGKAMVMAFETSKGRITIEASLPDSKWRIPVEKGVLDYIWKITGGDDAGKS